MFTVEFRAPRLGLVRLDPETREEALEAASQVKQMFLDNAPTGLVICTHIPTSRAWPQDVSDVIVAMARADNPLLVCNGILYQPRGSMGLQLSRMIRDAENPTRVASPEPWVLQKLFSKHATAEEQEIINAFLREPLPPEAR